MITKRHYEHNKRSFLKQESYLKFLSKLCNYLKLSNHMLIFFEQRLYFDPAEAPETHLSAL